VQGHHPHREDLNELLIGLLWDHMELTWKEVRSKKVPKILSELEQTMAEELRDFSNKWSGMMRIFEWSIPCRV
jgi:hypothetical protein